jgi:hypothetical protein
MGPPGAAGMPSPTASAPGQPPFGSSPVSQPTPNRGQEAAGMARLSLIVKLMQETLPLIGATSEPGQALLKSLSSLSKHAPPGSVPADVQKNTLQSLLQRQQQMAPQVAAMRAMQSGGGAPPMPMGQG